MELSEQLQELLGAFNSKEIDKKAKELVGENGSPNNGWLDKQDAARHLLGIGEIARTTHPLVAKGIGALYEFINAGSTEEDTKMDEHNNELALTLFNAKSKKELEDRVKVMIEKANFRDTSDKTKAVYLK